MPNACSDSLFINPVGAHVIFERSTDKKMTQSIWNFFEVIRWNKVAWVLATQKTRILHQQLTIIYCSMFWQHEREKICKCLWTDKKDTPPPSLADHSECKLLTTDQLAKWLLFQNSLNFIYLNSGYQRGGVPMFNGYHRRKWTRWQEFKSWTRLIAFHIALIPLEKVWIQLFSL